MKYITKYIHTLLSYVILLAMTGVLVVSAAAPSGGYTAGTTLNPDCAPGDTDCIVKASSLGWYAENAAAPATAPVATGASSIAFGDNARALAPDMFVYGLNAGNNASAAAQSNFFGINAGSGSTNANTSNFFGTGAGASATNASGSNFFGPAAGTGATNANSSNFFGPNAGNGATGASYSNFIGSNAGSGATGATYSNFLGFTAGNNALNANYSNFIGVSAGNNAPNAQYSNFIGSNAGSGATNAANAIFIGTNAGNASAVDTTGSGDWSILIGNDTNTAFKNSIALGKGATNSAVNQFMIGSGTAQGGVDTMILNATNANTCTIDVVGGAGLSCTSDQRLKTNIADLSNTDSLSKLLQVRTVSYNWKNGPTDTAVGFLAQDIEQYFPQVVTDSTNGYKAVSYGNLTPMIVSAIKEINLKVDTAILSSGGTTNSSIMQGIASWLGDRANGIKKLIVTEEICIDDVCVTKEDLRTILQNNQISNTTESSEPTMGIGVTIQ